MNSTTWLALGFIVLFVVLASQGSSSARGRSSNSDDDDDDSYKQIQDQMEEDNLYRLWQDSDY
ncbi:hypothetical protein [Hydrogenophaga sp.]|jgi:hypothetical protein|uniref:hypothetical protein n=1 Tax=Hydrogenophaga sp. TaxID=1904254 RepID=UPI00271D4A2A|nr:hypothetical protein [Hydrogenophaga sp.]MDO9131909.1 hypothetical protein [Hydrogenophaga sp.]MDP3628981.1 hypothetical protein [Hydrogenophaga sp.]MDZ4283872.1 hypothetical protein [Hydrogenophaga sp.]